MNSRSRMNTVIPSSHNLRNQDTSCFRMLIQMTLLFRSTQRQINCALLHLFQPILLDSKYFKNKTQQTLNCQVERLHANNCVYCFRGGTECHLIVQLYMSLTSATFCSMLSLFYTDGHWKNASENIDSISNINMQSVFDDDIRRYFDQLQCNIWYMRKDGPLR